MEDKIRSIIEKWSGERYKDNVGAMNEAVKAILKLSAEAVPKKIVFSSSDDRYSSGWNDCVDLITAGGKR